MTTFFIEFYEDFINGFSSGAQILPTVIGLIGFALNLASMWFKSHKSIMVVRSLAELTYSVVFLLTAKYTGLVMNFFGISRNIVYAYLVKNNKKTTPYVIGFSIGIGGLGIITAIISKEIWYKATLAIIAKLITTVSFGIKNEQLVRIVTMPSSILWFIYDAMPMASYVGMINDLVDVVSLVTAFTVYNRKIKTQRYKENQIQNKEE